MGSHFQAMFPSDLLHELGIRQRARDTYLRDRKNPIDVCGYCGKKVVWRELLPPGARIIGRSATKLIWTYRKKTNAMRPATIEHIRPLSEGGGNLPSNLMAACFECNNERSHKRREKPATPPKTKLLKNRKK